MSRFQTPAGDGIGPIIRDLAKIRSRLSELESPTGTSLNSLVAQVQEAIAAIGTTINAWLLANSYTKAQIDSLVASPGSISPGNVTASGTISATGEVVASGRIRSGNLYGNILSVDYRNVYVTGVDGALGHVPSSARFKQDIESYDLAPDVLLRLRLVTFRYAAAVAALGENAQAEIGLIAEEVHALGLHWLVDYETRYTEEGALAVPPFQGETERIPFGVKYERLVLAMLPWMQSVEERLTALGA